MAEIWDLKSLQSGFESQVAYQINKIIDFTSINIGQVRKPGIAAVLKMQWGLTACCQFESDLAYQINKFIDIFKILTIISSITIVGGLFLFKFYLYKKTGFTN